MPRAPLSKLERLTTLNLVCWPILIFCLWFPAGEALISFAQTGGFEKVPDVQFVYFYSMGRLFERYPGAQIYEYSLQQKVLNETRPSEHPYGPIPYPPFVGILFRPFSRLAFFPAMFIWIGFSLFLYLGCVALLVGRFFTGRTATRSLFFCFALSLEPFVRIISSAGISMVGWAALAVAFWLDRRNKFFWSGLALSACLYKPTLLLLILPMFFVTRQLRHLAGFATGSAALALLTTCIEGGKVWLRYWHAFLSFGSMAANRSSQGVIKNTSYVDLVSFFTILPGGQSPLGRTLLCILLAGSLLSLLLVWMRWSRLSEELRPLVWASTITWTLVLNLYVPIYDTILVSLSLLITLAVAVRISDTRLTNRTGLFCFAVAICSWITIPIAQRSGFQIMTMLLAGLGMMQTQLLTAFVYRAQDHGGTLRSATQL